MANRSAKRASTRTSVGPIQTATELAALVGRDSGQISRWVRRPDWPFRKQGPWPRSDVPKILNWIADTLERQPETAADDGEGMGPLRKEKLREEIRKIRAQANQAETVLARERGELLDAAEVEGEWAGIGAATRSGFQNLASQLVPLALSHGMPHESAPAFQKQIEEAVNAILRRLSSSDTPEADDGGGPQVS